MWFQILGPMRVTDHSGTRPVAGVRQRVLLGALLAHANQPMHAERLAEIVWDGAPPARAVPTLRTYVTRLRKSLGQGASRIIARDTGYLAEVGPEEVDALAFEAWCRDVGVAVHSGAWADASEAACRALALWQGAALVDVPSQALRDAWLPRLEQLRIQVTEWRIEAGLHLGGHEQLIPQLRNLTVDHPMREHFHAQLILALARSGRHAEALAAYQDARRTLVDELGIEPGQQLRQLHEQILAGNIELPQPTSPPFASPSSQSVSRVGHQSDKPQQLPVAIRHFVGREKELKALTELLEQGTGAGGAIVISAIGGTAGVGKTALAVHWARLHADRFPDGQLYLNLHGFDPSGAPMPPADALRRFLATLGVPGHRIPAELDELAALYRSRLADRRQLIFLDNAHDAAQVRPLLPGSPGCLVLVTSRSQLAELVALDGAVPLTLDLLTVDEAYELLTRRLGRERLTTHKGAADELIRACARLPLALNIAAARATFHPTLPLPELVDDLRDTRRCLDTLGMGDSAANIRAVFSWSYHGLDAEAARAFRLLGLHPGPDIGLEAASALTALDHTGTRRVLDELTRAHLVTEHAPGRFAFHDLLRAYAAEQAHAREVKTEQEAALRRLCDFYLHTARNADHVLHPYRPPVLSDPPAPDTRPTRLSDVTMALAWLKTEYPNVQAVQSMAVARRWYRTVWQMAWTLCTFRLRRGYRHDELAAWRAALDAADHLPDDVTLGIRANRLLGRAHADLGQHEDAIEHLHQALRVAEAQCEATEQAHTHQTLAWAWERSGDTERQLCHASRALDLHRTCGESTWEADSLNMVAWCTALLGDYAAARVHCRTALALHRRHRYSVGEADALRILGYIEHHTGHHQQAVDYCRQTLTLRRGFGDAYESANALDLLGHPLAALGQQEQARAAWVEAVELYHDQERARDAERVQRQLDELDQLNAV